MHYVRQETKNGCGAAVVAMLGDISFWEGVDIIGKSGPTNTKEVKNALDKLGFETADKLERVSKYKDLPSFCVLKSKNYAEGCTHWSVYKNGKYYDPCFGVFRFNFYSDKNSRITSFLTIYSEE